MLKETAQTRRSGDASALATLGESSYERTWHQRYRQTYTLFYSRKKVKRCKQNRKETLQSTSPTYDNIQHAYFHSKYRESHWFLDGDWALVKIQCLPFEMESLVQDSVMGPSSSSNSCVERPSSLASFRRTSPLATYMPSLT